jgi:serine/threonine protein kinase
MIPLDVSEEKVRRQIVLELKSLHQSQCEQVVTFFDAFCDEGNVLIALEFMGGGSLGDLLSDGVVFPEEILAPITEQVLSGLNYIHKTMRLIHRDIKPANLLINRSGEVKISDFGVSGELAHTLSQANTWVGTVVYMSPERIKGQPHSYDSDIWALGLTVLELAVGKLPFDALPQQAAGVGAEGAQFWELMESIVDGNPPRLPRKDFSEDCCDFVETCLQKDPENRPSARELLLRHFVKAGSGPDGAQRMHQWMREVLGGKK